jgi:hypothetical protein
MAAERVHTFLLQRRSGKAERIVVWDTQDVSAGRAPENDLVIESAEASREHTRFYRTEAGHSVQNLSTSNPTYVNDEPASARPLQNKDVVRIAETEFVFCQVTRNPVTLGIPVEYASQLKGFGPKLASGDAEATILGLMDTVGEEDDDSFVVRPAREFEHEPHGIDPPATRNLDLELAGAGIEDLDLPAASGSLSLTLEIEGLGASQRAVLEGLFGKAFELPTLRIRVKGPDLG